MAYAWVNPKKSKESNALGRLPWQSTTAARQALVIDSVLQYQNRVNEQDVRDQT